ncbi:hypothetical protein QR680_008922 [Steinernema hermaphroditum]|uniref:Uncharacterized protein n=1 Tax=Steinernema hermaphroditum TaxID=289476 RepID=A0AA39IIG2_9BILA|nr:hypothetical protein QR680_008922 [Steinernema hermaphroditum]
MASDDVVFGLWMIGLVTVFMPIYLRFLYCLYHHFKNIAAYQIMLHNGIPYVVQIAVEWFFGVFTAASFQPPMLFNKVCGGLWNAAFHAAVFNLLVLTVNRLVVICNIHSMHSLFRGRPQHACIVLQYVWGLAMFASYMTPQITIAYSLKSHAFEFIGDYGSAAAQFDLAFSECVLLVSALIYGAIFLFILKTRGQRRIERHELRILINIFCLHLTFGSLIAAYHLQPMFWSSHQAAGVLNLAIVVKCGSDPLCVLATNRSIRRRFLGCSDNVVAVSRTKSEVKRTQA